MTERENWTDTIIVHFIPRIFKGKTFLGLNVS